MSHKPAVRRRWILPVIIVLGIALVLAIVFLLSNRERLDPSAGFPPGQSGAIIKLTHGPVYYTWTGPSAGPVVVMVNPFSDPLFIWERNIDALAKLGYRVLSYDHYGRGFSDRPRVTYDLDLFVDQLRELLTALAVPTPVHLVGVSMGGQIAAAFEVRNPDLVGKLCLIDPQAVRVTWKTVFPMNIPGIGEYLMAVYVIPYILSSPAGDFYRPEVLPDLAQRYRTQTTYRGFRRALLSTLRNFPKDFMENYRRVGKLGKPVLLIWGEEDRTIPISYAPSLQEAMPQVQYHAIPEAGHLSNYERPDLVNPILGSFLGPAR